MSIFIFHGDGWIYTQNEGTLWYMIFVDDSVLIFEFYRKYTVDINSAQKNTKDYGL